MSRWVKWVLGVAAGLLLALLLAFYTPFGLARVGRLAAPLTGGQVRIDGLGGLFPTRLHAARVEVSDKNGVWLRIEDAALEWSALALISHHVDIDSVQAKRITVLRRPVPSESKGGENPRIDIRHLAAPDIELGAPVIGHAVMLTATGSLHFISMQNLAADLQVTRAASSDSYRVSGGIQNGVVRGRAIIREGNDGILGKLASLPGLGAVNLSAQADGDNQANTIAFQLSAGPMSSEGHGTIALETAEANIDMTLTAPAMALRPDLNWQALAGDVHVHGRFTSPQVRGHLTLRDGHFAGAAIKMLTLDADGDAGQIVLNGTAANLSLPGDAGLLAGSPLQIAAQANLQDPARPVRLSLRHPLAQLDAVAQTGGPLRVVGDITLPALAPLGKLVKTTLAGDATLHATLDQHEKLTNVTLNGAVQLMGAGLPARLLGKSQIAMTAALEGSDITASHLSLNGAAMKAEVDGTLRNKRLNYRLGLDLTDLSRLANTVQGTLTLKSTATGSLDKADLTGSGSAMMATRGFPRQRVTLGLKAEGLPALSGATLTSGGRLDGAPVSLHAAVTGGPARHVTLTGGWRSLKADANLSIAANGALGGTAKLALKQMADIAAFAGTKLSGAATMAATFHNQRGKTNADFDASLSDFRLGPGDVQAVFVKGSANDLTGKPLFDLALDAKHIMAAGWSGDSHAKVRGSLDALDIALDAGMTDVSGAKANAQGAAKIDVAHQKITLTAMTGDWRTLKLTLDSPATLQISGGLAVDRLAAHLGKGRFVMAGKLAPELSLMASIDNMALADFAAFAPGIGPQGSVSGTANLHGSLAAPLGHASLRASGLRAAFSPAGMTSADLTLTAELQGDHAVLDAGVEAGARAHLKLTGNVPLTANGQLALHAAGNADLALLDALTAASGRRIRGTITLDGDANGTLSAPRVRGSGSLADGEIQDYAQGVRIHDINASFSSDGTRLTLTKLTGRAGSGTLSASGHVDLMANNMPVEMKLDLQNARLVSSDLITGDLSGSVALTGYLKNAMTLAGSVQVLQASINVPQSFPPEVAVLNVRKRGQPSPPPPSGQSRVNLDLTVRTMGPVFVRGHGMDADMGGNLRIGGTTAGPAVSGSLRMNRGTFSLAGQTLTFTSGEIRFDGSGLRGRLDPSLNFVAQTISGGVTATLAITGYASQPKIALTSSPALPQDEVVAHLLFQQSVKQLSPLQLASIAQAAAEMGGIGGGFNPLGSVRNTLGLDRLSVGSTQGGASGNESQTTVEAGRYVTRNVYVGVKQNLSGGTQTQVQVDITRRLKAQATLSTGANATTVQGSAQQDNGNSVGMSYQFQY